tara:strand:- start:2930 stop:3541 length:612 start_codon:yes stop_codon:yes gene_type:complete
LLSNCAHKESNHLFSINDQAFTQSEISRRPDFALLKENNAGDQEFQNLIEYFFIENLTLREAFLRNIQTGYSVSESAAINWANLNFNDNAELISFLSRNNFSWPDIVIHFQRKITYENIMDLYLGVNDVEIKRWCDNNKEVLDFMWSEWAKGTKVSSPEKIPETYAYQYCRSALIQHKASNPMYKEKAIEAISRGVKIKWSIK